MLPQMLVLFLVFFLFFFFFNDTATTEIYTLSLHDALPIRARPHDERSGVAACVRLSSVASASPSTPAVSEAPAHPRSSSSAPTASSRSPADSAISAPARLPLSTVET